MIDTVEQEKSELVNDLQEKQDKIASLQEQLIQKVLLMLMDCCIHLLVALGQIPEKVCSTVQTVPQTVCERGTQFSYLVPMAGI